MDKLKGFWLLVLGLQFAVFADSAQAVDITTTYRVSPQAFIAEIKELEKHPELPAKMKEIRRVIQNQLPSLYKKSLQDKSLNVGIVNIREMFAKFEQVRVFENTSLSIPFQLDSQRASDFYITDLKIGFFNGESLGSNYWGRFGILLHVFLGASGYEDEDYALTMALVLAEQKLKTPEHQLFGKVDFKRITPQTLEQMQRKPGRAETTLPSSEASRMMLGGGGFTGVGGGGDGSSVSTKFEMLMMAPVQKGSFSSKFPCFKAWSDYTTFIFDLQNFELESNANLASGEVVVMSWNPQYPSIEISKTHHMSEEQREGLALKTLIQLCVAKYPKQD